MIRDDAGLAPLLPVLAGASYVALDTEFHTERHFLPRLMLIQLRVEDREPVLIDPLGPVDLARLCAALDQTRLIVHGGQNDLEILHRLGGLRAPNVFDTQVAAGCAGDGYPLRLQDLVSRHLAKHITKSVTLSDWSQRPLRPEQIRYATEDVQHLAALTLVIEARLARSGNVGISAACTAEIVARALAPADPETAWKRVQGAHLLDEMERSVLRALTAWRDARARELDAPRSNVLSDAILLDLARRQPDTIEAMRANRRLPSQVWKRDGVAVLCAIATGRLASPPPPTRRRPRVWYELVHAAARVAERARGVATELTLDDEQMERLAGDQPLEGWRAEALGAEFVAFLRGENCIVMPGSFSSIS